MNDWKQQLKKYNSLLETISEKKENYDIIDALSEQVMLLDSIIVKRKLKWDTFMVK